MSNSPASTKHSYGALRQPNLTRQGERPHTRPPAGSPRRFTAPAPLASHPMQLRSVMHSNTAGDMDSPLDMRSTQEWLDHGGAMGWGGLWWVVGWESSLLSAAGGGGRWFLAGGRKGWKVGGLELAMVPGWWAQDDVVDDVVMMMFWRWFLAGGRMRWKVGGLELSRDGSL